MDSSRRSSAALVRLTSGLFAVLAAFVSFGPQGRAQEGPLTPWVGEMGITETVEQIMAREHALNPEMLDQPRIEAEHEKVNPDRRRLVNDPTLSPLTAQWPLPTGTQAGQAQGPSAAGGQHGGPLYNPQTIGTSFQGISSSESPYVPPDSTGSVGPTQVLVCANGRIKVFSKTGTLGGLNVGLDTFFNSVRNNSGTSDPQVKYDRTSGRFFVTCVNLPTPNRVLIAVSSGNTITNSASFTFFFFQQDLVLPTGNTGQFCDYPKIGVDANAVVIGGNMFSSGGGFAGTSAWCVKKSSITSGGPIVATAFRNISAGGGPFAPTGVDNDDPTATESYIAGVSNTAFGVVVLRRISNPGGSPTISGNLSVSVPATSSPLGQTALGTSGTLDSIDDRLFDAMLSKNRSTGVTTLWTAHNIAVNSSGVASGGNRNGSRWYQFGNISGAPNLVQSGTLFDSAATNFRGFWMDGCAASGQGHMALATSYASAVDHAGCAASGRLVTDALGTTQAATLAVVSATNYGGSGSQRWGDYANVSVDPTDDQTMWSFSEYCNAANSWGVRVIKLIAPPPATPISCLPSNVSAGSTNFNVVVTGQSIAGSGFYDTEPGINRIAVISTSVDITVNSVTFTNGTTMTVNIDVSPTAANGPTDMIVINPDGQQVGSAGGILTIGGGSPGVAFCFGDDQDPSFSFCPCGNTGMVGHGCDNSVATGGALLTSSGTANPDTVVLNSAGELPTSLSIFLQGDGNIAFGAYFGDGIRCAGGSLKRLFTHNASGGVVSAPSGADLSITARSAALGDVIASGSTRYYQVYYRDPNLAFCPSPSGDSWNVSNGQSIVWP